MLDGTTVVHELQTLRDEGHLSDAILRTAVKKIKKSDPRFDWVGVYLFDEEKDDLWLHNYVGAPTEHARIPVGTGVCGMAVAEKKNQIVGDVGAVENYLACDPDVRSEIVVLIRAGDEIFGQIDIDSTEENAFTEEDEGELSAIADKLAEQIAAERR
ncbi:MAG: GAF domain-containing protein [Longimicrobiales bacterium]|nr:GAF domain-containing protein [Longimicrobiales bacterium]